MKQREEEAAQRIISEDFADKTDIEKDAMRSVLAKGMEDVGKSWREAKEEAVNAWMDMLGNHEHVETIQRKQKEGGSEVSVIDFVEEGGQYETKRVSGNEGWYRDAFKKEGKMPSQRSIMDYDHNETVREMEAGGATKEDIDALNRYKEKVEALEGLEDYVKTLDNKHLTAKILLNKDTFDKVYTPFVEELEKGNEQVKKAAKDSALILSKMAETLSRAYGVAVEDIAATLKTSDKPKKITGDELYQRLSPYKVKSYTADELVTTATITGKEFGEYTDIKDLRAKALTYYKEHLQGTFAHNDLLGDIRLGEEAVTKEGKPGDVKFTGTGRKEMGHSSGNIMKLLSIYRLKEIMENANIVGKSSSQKEKHQGWTFYYLHSAIDTPDGKQYVIVTVADKRKGTVDYYNHNIFTKEEYESIEKATGETSGNRITSTAKKSHEVASSIHSIYEAEELYKRDEENNGKNLVALHNISIEKLEKAIKLGGFPVPSIAITKKQTPYTKFGEITLIMDKNVANPEKENVYTRDVWTTTFPQILRKPIQKVLIPLTKDFDVAEKETGLANKASYVEVLNSWSEADAATKLKDALHSPLGKYVYLKSISKAPDITYRNNYRGNQVVDDIVLKEEIENRIADKAFQKGYENWVENITSAALDFPKIKVGRKKLPMTLDNLVSAMKGNTQNKQKNILGGMSIGNVIAAGGKSVKDIKELHKEADKTLAPEKDTAGAYESVKEQVDNIITDIISHAKDKNDFQNIGNAASVLVDVQQKKMSLSSALNKHHFEVTPEELKELQGKVSEVTNAIENLPVNYFEAKPNRAVGFNEVKAAVIPKGTPKEMKDFLSAQGIIVNEYDPEQEGHREQVTNEAQEKAGVYFQQTVNRNIVSKAKLEQDEAIWNRNIAALENGDVIKGSIHVMDTPIVMQMVGIENLPIQIDVSKLNKIKNDHPEMTASVLKQIPRALTNPIMISRSKTVPGRIIAALDIKGKNGVNVVVPFILNADKKGIKVNIIASAYSRKKASDFYAIDHQWFINNVNSGSLLYADRSRLPKLLGLDKKNTTALLKRAAVQFRLRNKSNNGISVNRILNESDLVKLKNENPEYYQQTEQYAGAYEAENNAIHIFSASNESTAIHEGAHFFLSTLEKLSQDTTISEEARGKIEEDLSVIRNWASYSPEIMKEYRGTALSREFREYEKAIKENPDDESAKERFMQERFARGFERYLLTGKAPSKELQGAFRRFKSWLTNLYRSAMNLGKADAPEEMRHIFDKMVATEEEIEAWGEEVKARSLAEDINKLNKAVDTNKSEADNIKEWLENIKETAKEKALSHFMKQYKGELLTQFDTAAEDKGRETGSRDFIFGEQERLCLIKEFYGKIINMDIPVGYERIYYADTMVSRPYGKN